MLGYTARWLKTGLPKTFQINLVVISKMTLLALKNHARRQPYSLQYDMQLDY